MIAQRGRASNALTSAGGRSQMGGTRERVYVPTLTVDTITQSTPKPDFIKIDVEGAEFAVLEGAQDLLSTHHPTIYVEIGQTAFSACRDLLLKMGYSVFGPDGKPTDLPTLSNYFFVHKSQSDVLRALQSFSL